MLGYQDVLTRPILHPHAVRLAELLDAMGKFAKHVSPTLKLSLCSDPDDDRFLNAR